MQNRQSVLRIAFDLRKACAGFGVADFAIVSEPDGAGGAAFGAAVTLEQNGFVKTVIAAPGIGNGLAADFVSGGAKGNAVAQNTRREKAASTGVCLPTGAR